MIEYIALDLETTGIHEGNRGWHQVVQVSLVAANTTMSMGPKLEEPDNLTFFMSTPDWENGEPYALAMNHLDWEDNLVIKTFPVFHTEQAKAGIQRFLNKHKGKAFAGFNVGSFDRQFLPGLQAPHRHWDIGSMWAAKFGPSTKGSTGIWTSEEISKELGLGEVKHDAYQDNLITIAAMHCMFGE